MTTIMVTPGVIRRGSSLASRCWPGSGPTAFASTSSPQGGSMSRYVRVRPHPARPLLSLTIVANPAWKRSDQPGNTGSCSAAA
jgi:hypothetical protein